VKQETVHCTVNLPVEANKTIEFEVLRTGIPKAIFLRCLIMKWVDKQRYYPGDEELKQRNERS